LRKKETTEINLRQINQDLESRCQNLEARCGDFESSIKAIQPKYQEALNDRGQFESDANTSLAREAQMRKERDLKDAELKKIQRQKAEVDSELAASRLTLASSTIPQIAELSNMKDEVERMTSENEKLKHRLNGMQKELEYIRTLYQNATNAATEATSEKRESQAEVADLREKADENKKRIHEIQRDTEIAAHLQRISELKAENEDLEREVEKKDAELKALSNGRRATRGASVPRSPRMGGTMSPGPARPIGRVIQMGGSGSRGNSPAPGDVGTGRTSFGEALFQGAPGPTARWGNHLQ
jgi:chromosome segregation ATPase